MRHFSARAWLGAALLGSLLVTGCRHCAHCAGQGRPMHPVAMAKPTPPETLVLPETLASAPPVVNTKEAPAPTPEIKQASFPAPVAASAVPPPVPASAYHVMPVGEKSTIPVGEKLNVDLGLRGKADDAIRRRSYVDTTARPGYAHAPDYSWLTGELDFVHVRNAWRVRYSSVDEEDRYGGSVTLTEQGPMGSFKAGQMVRIKGDLVDPESREPSPAYRVYSISPLDP